MFGNLILLIFLILISLLLKAKNQLKTFINELDLEFRIILINYYNYNYLLCAFMRQVRKFIYDIFFYKLEILLPFSIN